MVIRKSPLINPLLITSVDYQLLIIFKAWILGTIKSSSLVVSTPSTTPTRTTRTSLVIFLLVKKTQSRDKIFRYQRKVLESCCYFWKRAAMARFSYRRHHQRQALHFWRPLRSFWHAAKRPRLLWSFVSCKRKPMASKTCLQKTGWRTGF